MNAQTAPPNSATPPTRKNPENEWYVDLGSIRRMIEQTQEKSEDRGPEINALLDAFRISMTQILSNLDPKVVCLQTSAMMLATVAPQIAAQCKALSAQLSAPPSSPGGGGAPMGLGPMGASPMPPMPPGMGGMGGATAGPGPAPVTPPVVGG